MRTLREVLKEYPEKAVLIRTVIRKIGMDYVEDVNNYGIDGGFNGFTYYKDTCAFYRQHRKAINTWVIEEAEQLGENPVDMVCNFGCIKNKEYAPVVGRCIYDGKLIDNGDNDTTQIENTLAWFAAEKVCRMFED